MNVAGIRAALRIARRDAARAKGRSALVIAMVGLPMMTLAFADVAIRTAEPSAAERAAHQIGAADLVVRSLNGGTPDLSGTLPPGSRVVEQWSHWGGRLSATDGGGIANVEQLDLHDPIADGLVVVRNGTLPRAADEAAVSTYVAKLNGISVGGTVTLEGGEPFRVTGIVDRAESTGSLDVWIPPKAVVPPSEMGIPPMGRLAIDLPDGVSDVAVMKKIEGLGVANLELRPRTWYFDPPLRQRLPDAQTAGVTLVVLGLATLEVVLLAGAAFAVGARRRRRELALVAATGGDRRDVRRIVLAGGVVVGAVAGAVGVVGGIAAFVLARPLIERINGDPLGPIDLRPLELGALVAVGAITALVAALLPARAASRQPVVEALTGRRAETRTRLRVPVAGLVAVVAGTGLAFWAAGRVGHFLGPLNGGLAYTGGRPWAFLLLLAGAVVAELGFVACAPAFIGLVARLGSRLPLTLRLATRDAARHRGRSGPAVAAVVAAVAGCVAISVYLASETEQKRDAYQPRMPSGSVRFARIEPIEERDVSAGVAKLPVRERIEVYEAGTDCQMTGPCEDWEVVAPGGDEFVFGDIVAGDTALLRWAVGREDPALVQALADGKAVVLDGTWMKDGHVVLSYEGRDLTLPAVAADATVYPAGPAVVLSPETARKHKIGTWHAATVVTTTRMPTRAEEERAIDAASERTRVIAVEVERGFVPSDPFVGLILLAVSGVVTVGATGIATGLAAADSRPDLATLGAVGAGPGVRRRFAMAQAATVAGLGSALGILAGLVPVVAIISARTAMPVTMPWTILAATAFGVPAVTALVVGAFTRSRLPMVQRVT